MRQAQHALIENSCSFVLMPFCIVSFVFFCCEISVLNLCNIFFLLNFCRIKQKSCDNQPQLVVASHSIYPFNWIEIIKRNLFFVSNYGDHIECCCYWHLLLCLFSARCIFQTPLKHDTYTFTYNDITHTSTHNHIIHNKNNSLTLT